MLESVSQRCTTQQRKWRTAFPYSFVFEARCARAVTVGRPVDPQARYENRCHRCHTTVRSAAQRLAVLQSDATLLLLHLKPMVRTGARRQSQAEDSCALSAGAAHIFDVWPAERTPLFILLIMNLNASSLNASSLNASSKQCQQTGSHPADRSNHSLKYLQQVAPSLDC